MQDVAGFEIDLPANEEERHVFNLAVLPGVTPGTNPAAVGNQESPINIPAKLNWQAEEVELLGSISRKKIDR